LRIIDISRTVQEAPVYPGSENVKIEKISDTANGDECSISMICADSHMGTHADALSHFLPDSDVSIDKMNLELFCGHCRVLTVSQAFLITVDELRGKLEGTRKIILRTGGRSFLCEQAAMYLIDCGVKTVVTDALSVAPEGNEAEIHKILARGGAAIIENVILDEASDGDYMLFAFPIKYGGCDGAPVRAVLIAQ